jgi:multidrug efflux system membrane fusion protein
VPVQRLYGAGTDAAVSGLSGTEQVITEGKQNVRPGGKVRLASEMGKGNGEGKGGEGGHKAGEGKKGGAA